MTLSQEHELIRWASHSSVLRETLVGMAGVSGGVHEIFEMPLKGAASFDGAAGINTAQFELNLDPLQRKLMHVSAQHSGAFAHAHARTIGWQMCV